MFDNWDTGIILAALFGGKTKSEHSCIVANNHSLHTTTVCMHNYEYGRSALNRNSISWTEVYRQVG